MKIKSSLKNEIKNSIFTQPVKPGVIENQLNKGL
jgi:hypothetical protein